MMVKTYGVYTPNENIDSIGILALSDTTKILNKSTVLKISRTFTVEPVIIYVYGKQSELRQVTNHQRDSRNSQFHSK